MWRWPVSTHRTVYRIYLKLYNCESFLSLLSQHLLTLCHAKYQTIILWSSWQDNKAHSEINGITILRYQTLFFTILSKDKRLLFLWSAQEGTIKRRRRLFLKRIEYKYGTICVHNVTTTISNSRKRRLRSYYKKIIKSWSQVNSSLPWDNEVTKSYLRQITGLKTIPFFFFLVNL